MPLGDFYNPTGQGTYPAGSPYGVTVAKRAGTADVGRWHAVMPLNQLLALLAETGWAKP